MRGILTPRRSGFFFCAEVFVWAEGVDFSAAKQNKKRRKEQRVVLLIPARAPCQGWMTSSRFFLVTESLLLGFASPRGKRAQ